MCPEVLPSQRETVQGSPLASGDHSNLIPCAAIVFLPIATSEITYQSRSPESLGLVVLVVYQRLSA